MRGGEAGSGVVAGDDESCSFRPVFLAASAKPGLRRRWAQGPEVVCRWMLWDGMARQPRPR